MHKKFIDWIFHKIHIEQSLSRLDFHEREVWWCHLGVNVGSEQDGKGEHYARPVLVFKKFNKEICWAIPITTKEKIGKFYVKIFLNKNEARWVIISQLRLIDSKRLIDKICRISKDDYDLVTKATIALCE